MFDSYDRIEKSFIETMKFHPGADFYTYIEYMPCATIRELGTVKRERERLFTILGKIDRASK